MYRLCAILQSKCSPLFTVRAVNGDAASIMLHDQNPRTSSQKSLAENDSYSAQHAQLQTPAVMDINGILNLETQRALNEAVNAAAVTRSKFPVQFIGDYLCAPGKRTQGPVSALDEGATAVLERTLTSALSALLFELPIDPVRFLGEHLRTSAAGEINLVRRGRAEFVFWADAHEPVEPQLQQQWTEYRNRLLGSSGYIVDPLRLLNKGIDLDEVRSWPVQLADTDEVVDWGTFFADKRQPKKSAMLVDARRQATYAARREQLSHSSKFGFAEAP